jgi:cyclin-dependent kinase 7
MPMCDGFEGNTLERNKIDDNIGNFKHTVGNNTGTNEPTPMSLNFSIFGMKPPNRPTITR